RLRKNALENELRLAEKALKKEHHDVERLDQVGMRFVLTVFGKYEVRYDKEWEEYVVAKEKRDGIAYELSEAEKEIRDCEHAIQYLEEWDALRKDLMREKAKYLRVKSGDEEAIRFAEHERKERRLNMALLDLNECLIAGRNLQESLTKLIKRLETPIKNIHNIEQEIATLKPMALTVQLLARGFYEEFDAIEKHKELIGKIKASNFLAEKEMQGFATLFRSNLKMDLPESGTYPQKGILTLFVHKREQTHAFCQKLAEKLSQALKLLKDKRRTVQSRHQQEIRRQQTMRGEE
ncbi:MAG: hypothetical protein AAF206_06050, partial [Bacteroidota bacterium]